MHFTYCLPPEHGDLQQGDVLAKSGEMHKILKTVHPHYLREDYSNFLVLTQTCDLVRRPECKSPYITLAAVRPLEIVLRRELQKFQSPLAAAAGMCSVRARDNVLRFVGRLLNNNEEEYFYLHQEPAKGMAENACAFLRLSISIQAEKHYKACLHARMLSLTSVFQAKLGWLTGNIYSRVGTEDWTPNNYAKSEFDQITKEIVDGYTYWIDDERLRAAEREMNHEILSGGEDLVREFIFTLP